MSGFIYFLLFTNSKNHSEGAVPSVELLPTLVPPGSDFPRNNILIGERIDLLSVRGNLIGRCQQGAARTYGVLRT